MKLPVLNNHCCEGLYDIKLFFCPRHYCWISHILFGILSLKFAVIMPLFILYQLSQIIKKGEIWEDFIDIIEFMIGRYYIGLIIL